MAKQIIYGEEARKALESGAGAAGHRCAQGFADGY